MWCSTYLLLTEGRSSPGATVKAIVSTDLKLFTQSVHLLFWGIEEWVNVEGVYGLEVWVLVERGEPGQWRDQGRGWREKRSQKERDSSTYYPNTETNLIVNSSISAAYCCIWPQSGHYRQTLTGPVWGKNCGSPGANALGCTVFFKSVAMLSSRSGAKWETSLIPRLHIAFWQWIYRLP